jgi:hypothetical protein
MSRSSSPLPPPDWDGEVCDICGGYHHEDQCPSHDSPLQCDDCGIVCQNTRSYNKHLTAEGDCPHSVVCDECEEQGHYARDCPWCLKCTERKTKCTCQK